MSSGSSSSRFHFASALSTTAETATAVAEVCRTARETLSTAPDLALLFVSHHHAETFSTLAGRACELLETDRLIGCAAEAVAGVGREVEEGPAISLWLASLPAAQVRPIRLRFERTPEGGAFLGWPDALMESWPDDASLLLLADGFSFPADALLQRLGEDRPGTPIVGGMASGGAGPECNRLFLGGESHADGAVAVLLSGGVRVRSVVSQGCRPIGRHFVITKAERNIVHQLGGLPAMERFEEVYRDLAVRERELISKGLHLGRVVSEYQDRFEQGDFLVRNVIGADRESGAMAIGDWVRPGQTVQFHVRDAETADGELHYLLSQMKKKAAAPQAALLFTCNGRGTRLFPEANHDAAAVRRTFGDIPLAGFFAQGEIGPIGGKCFLHGLTASIALFEEASGETDPSSS
ncbi:MAG: FIST C-terminal domain-containing protein [Planctomycetes bacterium]|nr:FIST C-terminal domain-containing protein [Planctomycetota bacterium]